MANQISSKPRVSATMRVPPKPGLATLARRVLAAALVQTACAAVPAPAGLWAQAGSDGAVSLPVGTPAPSVLLEDLDGNAVDLLQLIGGRPAIVEFWASWCEQCEGLQPQLDELHERFGDELAIVAVAVGVAQTPRRVRRHVEQHGTGYPYLWDGEGRAVRAFDALTTSIVVMLDSDGTVAYTGVGADQELVSAAEALLKDWPPT